MTLVYLGVLAACGRSCRGDCYTLTYGGANGNPSDVGAYASWYSTVYRLNGNEVYSYSTTAVSGPNAGLIITNVYTRFYRNGVDVTNNSAAQTQYGATIQANTWQYLYSSGQYYLGTFQLGQPSSQPSATENAHWGTSPYCSSLGYPYSPITYYDYSNTYAAVKPTISGPSGASSAAIWYLGGAPSIDGYWTQTVLTGNANWGSAQSLYWTVIQNPNKASLNATVATQVTVTSQAANASSHPGSYDYDVLVQASTDGLPSDPFPMSINAPWSLYASLSSQGYYSGNNGYQSTFQNLLYDVAGRPISAPITTHETIENCKPQYSNTSWCGITVDIDTWYPGNWSGAGFYDIYYVYGYPYPVPQYKTPTGTTQVMSKTQKFFVGAAGDPNKRNNVFVGMCVERDVIEYYQDHGERQTVVSPVASSACTQGQFAN